MAAIPSFAFPDMDASQLDDKMDVASSPFRQPDDIDIDLDSVRDGSRIGSPRDDMVDDPAEPQNTGPDVMEDQLDETLPDDDMNDEQNVSMLTEQPDLDYNMDASIEDAQGDEDEDILYEDEEDMGAFAQDIEVVAEYNASEDQPQVNQEVEADVILEEQDQPEHQNHADIDTNPEKTLADDASVAISAEDAAQGQDEAEASKANISDTSRENVVDQTEVDQAPEQAQGEQRDDVAELPEQHAEAKAGEPAVSLEESGHPGADTQPTTEANEAEPQDQHEEPAKNEDDGASPTVHPVTLVYLEEEMSLFPPMIGDASSVYFLPDASLAFEPLDKLLAACREVLAGTLDHHDELVLDVPGLGLHICEDSKYAAQITLSQILDVYLQLCNNHAGQAAQPLYCHLSSRVSLASQYTYLCSAGAEGKTYAEIAADHSESPELEGDDEGKAGHYEEHQKEGDQLPTEGETEVLAESTHSQSSTARADGTDTFGHEEVAEDKIPSDHVTRDPVPRTSDVDRPEALTGTEVLGATEEAELLVRPDHENIEPEYVYDETREPEDSGSERELRAEAQDQPQEEQEHETNSSHTVEADVGETDLQDVKASDAEVEGLGQSNEEAEDLFQHEEDGLELEANYEPYGDEELLGAQDEFDENVLGDLSATIQDEDPIPIVQNTDGTDVSQTQPLLPSNDAANEDSSHEASAVDAQYPGNLSPPMTPVKGKQAKRKAEEEDELLLDLDTPEPKRRRPS